ncbi:hypothetical protein [Candidatus Poriferisocius sp.]|uniref:hypothetical protein n=1 Tax=Candidatus Poriferisocius sp. TaxID=3101276 RepID=UPI003B01D554
MVGASGDPQGAVERWWAAVADGDGVSIVILAAASVGPLLLRVAFEYLVRRLPGEPAGPGLGRRWLRFRSVLQPSRYAPVESVYEYGRMPLDPRLKFNGRLGIARRLFFLATRPSSPKPAFLVSSVEVLDSVQVRLPPQGPVVRQRTAGKRIFIALHPNENPKHLKGSLTSGRARPLRTLLVCPLEDFLDPDGPIAGLLDSKGPIEDSSAPDGQIEDFLAPDGPIEVLFVDRRYAKKAADDKGAAVVYSADPLYAQRQHDEIVKTGKLPDDAIWLFLTDPSSATGEEDPDRSSDQAAARDAQSSPGTKEQVCPPCGNESDERALPEPCGNEAAQCTPREPWDATRWGRYLATAVPLAAGAVLPWSMIDHGWGTELPGPALIGVILGWELVSWVGVSMLVLSCYRYLKYEKSAGRQWTATTTSCLADGRKIRRGHRKNIKRGNRYRTRAGPPTGQSRMAKLRLLVAALNPAKRCSKAQSENSNPKLP